MISKTKLLTILSSNDNVVNQKFFYLSKNVYISNWDFTNSFLLLTRVLKIFIPELLQSGTMEQKERERDNFILIQKNIKYGIQLIDIYKEKITITYNRLDNLLIDERSFEDFSNMIVYPLLKNIYNKTNYNWITLKNKEGLWRRMIPNESMSVGSEVSMNFETSENWIKL
jgi:hypothetical protein